MFQAEDGIRDYKVTGVQTCALPILSGAKATAARSAAAPPKRGASASLIPAIGRSTSRDQWTSAPLGGSSLCCLRSRSEERRGGSEWGGCRWGAWWKRERLWLWHIGT